VLCYESNRFLFYCFLLSFRKGSPLQGLTNDKEQHPFIMHVRIMLVFFVDGWRSRTAVIVTGVVVTTQQPNQGTNFGVLVHFNISEVPEVRVTILIVVWYKYKELRIIIVPLNLL
jgi:hypothetical protein